MKNFLKILFFGTSDEPSLELQKDGKGDCVKAQVGFSWSLLLLSTFFGLPLLSRRLWGWAAVMFGLSTVEIFGIVRRFSALLQVTDISQIETAMRMNPLDNAVENALLVCSVVLAFKGNEWTVRNLLKKGWRFVNPDDALVQKAAAKWHLSKHYLKTKKKV